MCAAGGPGDADAHAAVDALRAGFDVVAMDRVGEALCELQRGLRPADVGADDEELIAADATDDVGLAYRVEDAVCDATQQLIASGMPVTGR